MEAAIDRLRQSGLRQLETPARQNLRDRSEARARAILSDIQEGLAKGSLKLGDRLPDERSLCARYGAGRHTVRKALDQLVSAGKVTRRVGRGSFITAPPTRSQPASDSMPGLSWSLLELTEARLLLEPSIAKLALERATADDFDRLDVCLSAIEQADSWRDFKESKYAFHRALAEATRNSFVCHIFDLIVATRRKEWTNHQHRSQDMIDARAACLEESQAIVDALRAGDAETASTTIRRSITRILVTVCAL